MWNFCIDIEIDNPQGHIAYSAFNQLIVNLLYIQILLQIISLLLSIDMFYISEYFFLIRLNYLYKKTKGPDLSFNECFNS